MAPLLNTALIVVDVQRAFDEWEAAGKRRNNPGAVARISDLLDAFRYRHAPFSTSAIKAPSRTHRFCPIARATQ
jgi:nicotinamidase-related amidase